MVVSFPIGNQLSNLEGIINWQEVYTRSDKRSINSCERCNLFGKY